MKTKIAVKPCYTISGKTFRTKTGAVNYVAYDMVHRLIQLNSPRIKALYQQGLEAGDFDQYAKYLDAFRDRAARRISKVLVDL